MLLHDIVISKKSYFVLLLVTFSLHGMEENAKEEKKTFDKVIIFGKNLDYITFDATLLKPSQPLLKAIEDRKKNAQKPDPYYNHKVISTNLARNELLVLHEILSSKDFQMNDQAEQIVRQFAIEPWASCLPQEEYIQEQEVKKQVSLHQKILNFLHSTYKSPVPVQGVKKPKPIRKQPTLCTLRSYKNSPSHEKKASIERDNFIIISGKERDFRSYKQLILNAVKENDLQGLRKLLKPLPVHAEMPYERLFDNVKTRFDINKIFKNKEHARRFQEAPLLHHAIINNYNAVVKYLVEEAGADLTWRDVNHGSPLHIACRNNGNLNLLAYLVIYCNISPYEHSVEGKNALHDSIKSGHYDAVRYFIEELNISPLIETSIRPESSLFLAVNAYSDTKNKMYKIIKYLIKKCKMDPNTHKKGYKLLDAAFGARNLKVVKYLINCGASYLTKDEHGFSILSEAVACVDCGDPECLESVHKFIIQDHHEHLLKEKAWCPVCLASITVIPEEHHGITTCCLKFICSEDAKTTTKCPICKQGIAVVKLKLNHDDLLKQNSE